MSGQVDPALQHRHEYFIRLCDQLAEYATTGSALAFVPACSFLDYLAKLAAGEDNKGKGYKKFVREWLARVRPKYSTFTYLSGETDLPDQMYHILRCGAVHAFSLVPDEVASKNGGRKQSIVLGHRSAVERGEPGHLCNYSTDRISDAAVFIAEDFVEDIRGVTHLLFAQANEDPVLGQRVLNWLGQYPPITGGF